MKTIPTFWFETLPWIDGRWQGEGDLFTVTNPATGMGIAQVTRADATTVERAIAGAVAAAPRYGERWTRIAKDPARRGASVEAVLDAVVEDMKQPAP